MSRLAKPHVLKVQPYNPGKPIDEVKREYGLSDIIKMASNENPLGPSPKAMLAVQNHLSQMHIYPDGACFELRTKLADRLGVSESSLFFGNGSDEIIQLLGLAYLNPGDEVVIAHPTFARYYTVAELNNVALYAVPVTSDMRHDLTLMRERINENTKLVFIANPCNPLGTMVTSAEFDSFMDGMPPNVIVVMDEAYYEYVDRTDYPNSLNYLNKQVVSLRTFSKIYGLAGLRVGYAVAHPDLIKPLECIREPFNVNALAQIAAVAALDDDAHVEASRKVNSEGKAYLYALFDELKLNYVPSSANFVLFEVCEDGRAIYDKLLRLGVIIRPFSGVLQRYLRVTIGLPEENERFAVALRTVLTT